MCTHMLSSHIHQTNTLPSSHFQLCFVCCAMRETVIFCWHFCTTLFPYLLVIYRQRAFAEPAVSDAAAASSVAQMANQSAPCRIESRKQAEEFKVHVSRVCETTIGFSAVLQDRYVGHRQQPAVKKMGCDCKNLDAPN